MALSFLGLGGDIVTSPDGIRWLNWFTPFIGVNDGSANSTCVVIGGVNSNIPVAARSTDGHTFTSSTVANPHSTDHPLISSIGINNSFGIAVGLRPLATPATQAQLWTSGDDGVTWTDVAQPSFLSGIGSVSFGKIYCDDSLTIVYGKIAGVPFGMTTTDGTTWTTVTAPTNAIQKIVKAGIVYYALAFASDGTALLGTSSDAIAWTYQAQPDDNSNSFHDIGASNSLVALVGSTGAGLGLIETSANGGATWTQATLDASIEEVDAIAVNGTTWAATGFNTPDFANIAISSIDNGATWVLGPVLGQNGCSQLILYDVVIATSSYNLFLFDDCCHLWVSFDLGITWSQSFQSIATLSDDFTDASMAIADGDYSTMLVYDISYASTQQGQIALSKSTGRNGTWTFYNPDVALNPPSDSNNWIEWQSGAITNGGAKMILMPRASTASGVPGLGHIRITDDGGATWGDTATGLGARAWMYACIAKGGRIMYAMSVNSPGISKSTDGGATWSDLVSSPNVLADLGDEDGGRIRCSDDGSVVIVALNKEGTGGANEIHVSSDSGATWSSPVSLSSTSDIIDAAISSDGSVMMVIDNGTSSPYVVRYSTDSGGSWTSHDFTSDLPVGATNARVCNVSPDGIVMLVGFNSSAGYVAAVSTNSGATWSIHSFASNFPLFSLVTAFVTPPPPNNPYGPGTPVPPFPTPKGGYIIERLDDRIWPTVENCWCVDCGFTLEQPQPSADLEMSTATGAGILTGVTGLVGGTGYSSATTAQVVDNNGLGPGTGAVPVLTIIGGVITAISFSSGGTDYIYPALVFNDPENAGSGASATITMDNSAMFIASAPVFASGDVGSVIRAGYGVAVITSFVDTTHVVANIISPIAQTKPDDPIEPDEPITFTSGTWTMTEPISQFYLPQLIGFEITGLADGQIIPPTVVPTNGIVTLATPASAIIVGLGFTAQLQSTYLDAGEPTVQGQRKKIAEVTVRVEQSAAFQVGGNQPDGSVQSPQQLAPEWQNMVDAPTHAVAPFNSPALPLYTGDIRVPIPSGYNTRGQVAVQQLNPLPLQVLDYVPEILSGDKPAQEAPQRQRGKGNQQQ